MPRSSSITTILCRCFLKGTRCIRKSSLRLCLGDWSTYLAFALENFKNSFEGLRHWNFMPKLWFLIFFLQLEQFSNMVLARPTQWLWTREGRIGSFFAKESVISWVYEPRALRAIHAHHIIVFVTIGRINIRWHVHRVIVTLLSSFSRCWFQLSLQSKITHKYSFKNGISTDETFLYGELKLSHFVFRIRYCCVQIMTFKISSQSWSNLGVWGFE